MPVYVVDAPAVIGLAARGYRADAERELFAPTLLRSQVHAILHGQMMDKHVDAQDALELAERACRLPRRLLGDAVLRHTAWVIATEQGWHETYDAEYIALTRLHGEALISGSAALRDKAAPLIRVETVELLLAH